MLIAAAVISPLSPDTRHQHSGTTAGSWSDVIFFSSSIYLFIYIFTARKRPHNATEVPLTGPDDGVRYRAQEANKALDVKERISMVKPCGRRACFPV